MASYKTNLKHVEEHLNPGEEIIGSVYGSYEKEILGNKTHGVGVLVTTNKRIVFYAKGWFGYELENFAYEKISSIRKKKDLLGITLEFTVSNNSMKLRWIRNKKEEVEAFYQHVEKEIQ